MNRLQIIGTIGSAVCLVTTVAIYVWADNAGAVTMAHSQPPR